MQVRVGLPKSVGGRIVAALGGFATLAGAVKAFLALPPPLLLGSAEILFLLLGLGWVSRSVVHGIMGYFFPIHEEWVQPYRLACASAVNAIFAVIWLIAGIAQLGDRSPAFTLIGMGIALIMAFPLSLGTLAAAKAARVPRGSEWVRDHLRDPLEPGDNTIIGWPLVKLIDCRSPEKKLSTFVGGTLALLVVVSALALPASLGTRGGSENEGGPASTAGQAPKVAPGIPRGRCDRSLGIPS